MFGVPDTDVAGHPLCVAVTGPDAEGPCHVLELPMAFQLLGGEAGDSWGAFWLGLCLIDKDM